MAASADWRIYPSRAALAEALAGDVAKVLAASIDSRGKAVLAVSGGSTPGLLFTALSKHRLDWANVVVTLVDERFVPPSSERSNERLVRERLLVNEARLARFVPLYSNADTAEQAAAQAKAGLDLFGPLDVSILGMGTDGHTASFFPDANNLGALLDPAAASGVEAVHAPSAGEPRLTQTLARLLNARFLALHIEGEEKRTVLEEAVKPGSRLPIGAVFQQSTRALPIYWAA